MTMQQKMHFSSKKGSDKLSKPKEINVAGKPYFAWPYEDQTQVKHNVLRAYSKIWIAKVGCLSNTLFFDCHGGCGAYIKEDGSVHFGSSIIVKTVGDEINKNRTYKTGVYYCEIDRKNYDNFCKVIENTGSIKTVTFNDSFENVIRKQNVIKNYKKYPTLFLVDPFGYNFALADLSGLMNSFGNEIIVNFMFDFINRFISKPDLEESLNSYFGTNEWKQAKKLTGQQRETFLVYLFRKRFKEVTGAKYVFPYRLCYPDKNQTYYYLIHATNHIDGITYMKEAFASLNNGRVQYLGKNNDVITLFDWDCFKADDIYNSFLKKYKKDSISFDSFWSEIVEDTAYTIKDLSKAVTELESIGKVTVTRIKSKRGSYKGNDIIHVL